MNINNNPKATNPKQLNLKKLIKLQPLKLEQLNSLTGGISKIDSFSWEQNSK